MNAEAILSIQRLIAEYCQAYDDRDFTALAELFAVDAVLTVAGQTCRGRDAIRAGVDGPPTEAVPGQHSTSPSIVDIDPLGVTARARTDFHYFERTVNGYEVSTAGRYWDRFARESFGWRFTARTITHLGEAAPVDW